MPERPLRVFVSSPTDVEDERRRVDLVADRLNVEFKGRIRLETVRWEERFYSAHDTFQTQIPAAVDCEVVVAIFRSRLGTELPPTFQRLPSGEPYPSGTAYEVLTAIDARRAGGKLPDIYVFRYPDAPSVVVNAPESPEITAQWNKLTLFFESWFRTRGGEFIAAFQEYRTVDGFAEQVDRCLRQWLGRQGFLPPEQAWNRALLGSPFPGLSPYGADRSAVYCGRENATKQAIARLRRLAASEDAADRPFLLIIGASGAGKSSLLRAGLLPTLVTPGIEPAVDMWRAAIMTPDADPFAALASALLAGSALGPELRAGAFGDPGLLAAQLAGPPVLAILPLREALDRAAGERRGAMRYAQVRPARLALGIDQAERLFSEASPEVAARFGGLVAAMLREELAYVAVALRSDAYPRFQAVEAFAALCQSGATLDLLLPTQAELDDIVVQPVATCDPPLAFEVKDGRSLSAVLVSDAQGGDALPLLQLTLACLYEAEAERGDGVLAFADYRGMAAAVTETGDAALAQLDEAARAQLPALIGGLLGDVRTDPTSGERVPLVAPLDRQGFEAGNPARAALVEGFVAHRLLVSEGVGAAVQLRPVHEALLRIWPRARAVVAEIADLVQVRHALAPLVRAWGETSAADRPRHLDLSPALLGGAQHLLDTSPIEVPPAMRTFAEAAVAAFRRREAAERRRQQRLLASTLAALAIVFACAATAGWQWWRTGLALDREHAAREVASSQTALRDGRLLAAVHAGRLAYEADPSSDSRSALWTALAAVSPHLLRVRSLDHGTGTALAWGGADSVAVGLASGAAVELPISGRAPSARTAAGASDPIATSRATVALQRLADGRLIGVRRDASIFVVAAGGVDTALPGPPPHLTADPGSAMSVAVDSSGTRIAVASVEAGLVTMRQGHPETSPAAGGARIRAVAFSPGGDLLAHGDDDGIVTVAGDGTAPEAWTVPVGGKVATLAWSHDGRWLAAGTTQGRLALIDAGRRTVLLGEDVADHPVSVLAWSPVDDRLAFNCRTLMLCLWRPLAPPAEAAPEPPILLNGHQMPVRAVAWSPDGASLASLDTDGRLFVWSTGQNTDVRFTLGRAGTGDIAAITAGPDGAAVFGGSSQGTVYAWSPLVAAPRRLPNGDGGAVEALAFAPDGRLAAARSDGVLSVWAANTGVAPADIPVSTRLSQVGWAPDGSMLATLDPDARTVWLKRPDTSMPATPGRCAFAPGDTRPEGLAWAPDRPRLFVSVHGAIRPCDPDAGWVAAIPTAGNTSVAPMSLSVSRDGRWLATTGGEASASLYDLQAPSDAPRALPTGAGEPTHARFSPDGLSLAVIGTDGTLSLWRRAAGGDMSLAFRVGVLGVAAGAELGAVVAITWAGDHRVALAFADGTVELLEFDFSLWQRRVEMLDDDADEQAQ